MDPQQTEKIIAKRSLQTNTTTVYMSDKQAPITEMTKANGKCNRCSGTGFRNCAQAHLGVPGLCFDCDGSGRYEDQARRKAEVAAHKKAEDRRRAATQPVYDKIWAVRNGAKALGY